MSWQRVGPCPEAKKYTFEAQLAREPELANWLWNLPNRGESEAIRAMLLWAVRMAEGGFVPQAPKPVPAPAPVAPAMPSPPRISRPVEVAPPAPVVVKTAPTPDPAPVVVEQPAPVIATPAQTVAPTHDNHESEGSGQTMSEEDAAAIRALGEQF